MAGRVETIETIVTADRGRGAAPRAEPRQAPPAAVQRPAARRQVVPVHRGHGRGRLPARHVHARAAPPRRRLLRPVREREEGARDARRAQPRLPLPAVRRAAAGAAQRHPVPRLPHRALPRAVRRLHLEGGLPRADRAGDRVPLGRRPADPAPARASRCARPRPRSGSRTPRATATGCARSSGWPSARRSSAKSIGTIDVIGVAVSDGARGGAGVPAARGADGRPLLVPPRERRGRGRSARCSSSSASSTTARAPSIPPQILVPQRRRATRARSRSSSPSAAARASRCACPSAARSGGCRSSRSRTPQLALESETFVAETKRARRVEALEELREALNLESLPIRIECFDISNIQGQEIVGSMVVFEDARREEGPLPQVHGARRRGAGRLRVDARGDLAPLLPARRRPGVGGVERVVRGDAEPRRDRRRQGPAVGRARGDAGARPAARRGDRAREADRGGVRARPAGADPAARPTRRACSCCSGSATRRTASRSRSTGSGATAPRASRCSTSSRASARRAGGRCCSTSARPSGSSAASQEELEGVPGVPAKTARRIYAQLHRTGGA